MSELDLRHKDLKTTKNKVSRKLSSRCRFLTHLSSPLLEPSMILTQSNCYGGDSQRKVDMKTSPSGASPTERNLMKSDEEKDIEMH